MRRVVPALALILIVACSAPSTAPTSPTASTTVSVKILQGADTLQWSPSYIARQKYFKEQNVDAESVVIAGGLAALIAGDVQFALTVVGVGVTAVEQGQPVIALMALTTQYGNSMVMRKDVAARLHVTYESSEETKIKALKGLKIGVAVHGGGAEQMAIYLLKKYGIDPQRDVELVAGQNQSLALAAGQLDAFVFPSPDPDDAVQRGDAIWLVKGPAGDIKELNPMDYAVLYARKDYVQQNREIVQRVVTALVKGMKLMKDSPDQAKPIVKQFFSKLSDKTFDEAWATNLPSFGDPAITRAGFDANTKFLGVLGQSVKASYEQFADNTFSEAAKKEVAWK